MTQWHADLRQRFPALRSWCYLNTAAAGPISMEVARAGVQVYESLLGNGDADWEGMFADAERARASLAELAGCHSRELAFTHSTSHSVSLVAQMFWDAGVRGVVALEDEFPASTIPFLHRGFDVRFVKPDAQGQYSYEDISDALEGRQILVSSHVMYRTGAVVDPVKMGDVAKARGAYFVLCATQSLGALQVDFHASGAAFLTGTSHKWMCAGFGAGYLAMREDLFGKLPWPSAGWLSNREPFRMRNDVLDLVDDARVFELGSTPFAPVLSMGAAARLWLQADPARVEKRVKFLTKALRERLRDAGFDAPDAEEASLSGITIVAFKEAEKACAQLQAQRISTSARGAGIRLGVHAYNDEKDLDRVVEVLSGLRAWRPA